MTELLTTKEAMVVAEDIHKHFVSGAGVVRAVDGVTFHLPPGRLVVLRGPSGCGKSTLLNLLGALDRADSGALVVAGTDLRTMSGHAAVLHRRNTVGFVFQLFNLLPRLSAVENVMLPMELRGDLTGPASAERAMTLLAQVGLPKDRLGRRPSRLSGGEQQRVAIARALANDPRLVLADEPTANLDSKTGAVIVKLLRSLAGRDRTVLIATHDDAVVGQADLVLEMLDGQVVSQRERSPGPRPSR